MDFLAIIVALWLMLVGVYGGLSLVASTRRRRQQRRTTRSSRSTTRSRTGTRPAQTAEEVEALRAQVETLRSEVVALSGGSIRSERPRQRRHRTGQYTDLPPTLRRHVRKVRNFRHPLGV